MNTAPNLCGEDDPNAKGDSTEARSNDNWMFNLSMYFLFVMFGFIGCNEMQRNDSRDFANYRRISEQREEILRLEQKIEVLEKKMNGVK